MRRRAEAPDDVVVELGPVARHLALGAEAGALAAAVLAAAVLVGDQIGLVVVRIDAAADPAASARRSDPGGHDCRSAAAAGAEIAVRGAVAPVVALGRIGGLRGLRELVGVRHLDETACGRPAGAAGQRRRRRRPRAWSRKLRRERALGDAARRALHHAIERVALWIMPFRSRPKPQSLDRGHRDRRPRSRAAVPHRDTPGSTRSRSPGPPASSPDARGC